MKSYMRLMALHYVDVADRLYNNGRDIKAYTICSGTDENT